jgi:outer membrane protein assembly factor BamE (lipoprotein component of BamABCDE complex)
VITASVIDWRSVDDGMQPPNRDESMSNEVLRDGWATVVANNKKIDIGMSKDKVYRILGKPDLINPLFEPQKKGPRQIGFSWFYMKEPKTSELDESVIVIRFNNRETVMGIDSWGLGP